MWRKIPRFHVAWQKIKPKRKGKNIQTRGRTLFIKINSRDGSHLGCGFFSPAKLDVFCV
jgi:hypothetical protein